MAMSRIASASRGIGAVAALLFAGIPAAIQLGLTTSKAGFPLFLFGGGGLGLVALVTGLVGLLRTRAGSGREGRGRALAGTLLGGGILLVAILLNGPALSLPPINDITTSPGDPPAFVAALNDPANQGRDMSYPGAEFTAQQTAAYPDLAPIELATTPAETLARIAGLVPELGWELVDRDDATGRIEATETSGIFEFVDDVVVRVRPTRGGSLVDVRSKSREGRGDLGANAARIRQLRDALGS